MSNQIYPFLISSKIGSKYHVYDSWIKLDNWSSRITEKIQIAEIKGQASPNSISAKELCNDCK